ncbi:MAG: UDP-glucose 4-epimerase GalE [Methyloligellaceae bacterium]
MTILVTGGAGYIGSHMVLELISHGEKVVILDNLSTGFRFLVPDNISFIEGDISDGQLVTQILQNHDINAIIHFAGSIIVPESVEKPLDYYHNNTAKSRDLIALAIKHGVKHFIFSSTAAVYGIPDESPVNEETRLSPISPYGSSKMMTEIMLQDAAYAHDFNFVALRYFNVAGADPECRVGQSTTNATHLIKIATAAALGKRSSVSVFGTDYPTPDGTGVRDYIHVSDLANAHKLALDYLRSGGTSEIMNCGYGKGYSVLEVINTVKEVTGTDFSVELVPRRAGDPADLVANSVKIKDILSWKPQFNNLNLIIEHALSWEKSLEKRRPLT